MLGASAERTVVSVFSFRKNEGLENGTYGGLRSAEDSGGLNGFCEVVD